MGYDDIVDYMKYPISKSYIFSNNFVYHRHAGPWENYAYVENGSVVDLRVGCFVKINSGYDMLGISGSYTSNKGLRSSLNATSQ